MNVLSGKDGGAEDAPIRDDAKTTEMYPVITPPWV